MLSVSSLVSACTGNRPAYRQSSDCPPIRVIRQQDADRTVMSGLPRVRAQEFLPVFFILLGQLQCSLHSRDEVPRARADDPFTDLSDRPQAGGGNRLAGR